MTAKSELIRKICAVEGGDERPAYLSNFPESELRDYYDRLKRKQKSKRPKAEKETGVGRRSRW